MWIVLGHHSFWKEHTLCWKAMPERLAVRPSLYPPIDEIVSRGCFVVVIANISKRPLVHKVVHFQIPCPACLLVDLAKHGATQEGIALESIVKKSCFEAMNLWNNFSRAHNLGKEWMALWISVGSCSSRACIPFHKCFHSEISIQARHNGLTKKPRRIQKNTLDPSTPATSLKSSIVEAKRSSANGCDRPCLFPNPSQTPRDKWRRHRQKTNFNQKELRRWNITTFMHIQKKHARWQGDPKNPENNHTCNPSWNTRCTSANGQMHSRSKANGNLFFLRHCSKSFGQFSPNPAKELGYHFPNFGTWPCLPTWLATKHESCRFCGESRGSRKLYDTVTKGMLPWRNTTGMDASWARAIEVSIFSQKARPAVMNSNATKRHTLRLISSFTMASCVKINIDCASRRFASLISMSCRIASAKGDIFYIYTGIYLYTPWYSQIAQHVQNEKIFQKNHLVACAPSHDWKWKKHNDMQKHAKTCNGILQWYAKTCNMQKHATCKDMSHKNKNMQDLPKKTETNIFPISLISQWF